MARYGAQRGAIDKDAELEKELADALGQLECRIACMQQRGIPVDSCRRWLDAFQVELGNIGLSTHGRTLVSPYAHAPKEVERLANLLQLPTHTERNTLHLTPFECMSVGSSALVTYTDKASGELYVLLQRPATTKKNASQQWMLPAGYLDAFPQSGMVMPYRDVARQRHGTVLAGEAMPSFRHISSVIERECQRLLADAQAGWQAVVQLGMDGGAMRALLERNGIHMPDRPLGGAYEFGAPENAVREIHEETGVDVLAEGARLIPVTTHFNYVMSSAGQRPYTVNPHFLAHLGVRDAAPPTAPRDCNEVAEAVWVPLKRIKRQQNGTHWVNVEGNGMDQPLFIYAIVPIEEGLHKLLCERIRELSGGVCESPATLFAATRGWTGRYVVGQSAEARAAAEIMAQNPPGEGGTLQSLMGEEGQRRFDAYCAFAAALGKTSEGPPLERPCGWDGPLFTRQA